MSTAPPTPSPRWAYFLDVDGTLVDLAPTPDAIHVGHELPDLIARLHAACAGAVALVSGRAVADIDARLGLSGMSIAGLHGLEWRICGEGIQRDGTMRDIGAIADALHALRRRHDGLLVEDKGGAIALHYRQSPRLGGFLHRWVRRLVDASAPDLHVQPGKRVIEIKPRGRDKGHAIETFMARQPFSGRLPVFIGDDLTDEHGFAVANRLGGLSIKVGPGKSVATHRLRNVAAVRDWLALVANAEERKEACLAVT